MSLQRRLTGLTLLGLIGLAAFSLQYLQRNTITAEGNYEQTRLEKVASRKRLLSFRAVAEAAAADDPIKAAVYGSLVDLESRNHYEDPEAVSWLDLYDSAFQNRVGDVTLTGIVLSRLANAGVISAAQRVQLKELIGEERRSLESYYLRTYADIIDALGSTGMSPEEGQSIVQDLVKRREAIRAENEDRFLKIIPDESVRNIARLHLRNDLWLSFVSDGRIRGGIGLRPKDFHLLELADGEN